MNDDELSRDPESRELWRRLGPVFFRKPAPPTPFETEAFVSRVMGRVEERRAAGSPVRIWLRWMLPAAGLAALLAVAVPAPEAPPDFQLMLDQNDGGLAEYLLGPELDAAGLLLSEEP
jgi:hypothetical protein